MLEKQEVTLVVQINGKKRGLIVAKKDLSEKDALIEAKKIENIKKNLKDKKILKNIFVKNKIINFIILDENEIFKKNIFCYLGFKFVTKLWLSTFVNKSKSKV